MNFKKLSFLSGIIFLFCCYIIISVADFERKDFSSETNINVIKKLDIFYEIKEKEYKYVDTYALGVGEYSIIKNGKEGITAIYDNNEILNNYKGFRGSIYDIEILKYINKSIPFFINNYKNFI